MKIDSEIVEGAIKLVYVFGSTVFLMSSLQDFDKGLFIFSFGLVCDYSGRLLNCTRKLTRAISFIGILFSGIIMCFTLGCVLSSGSGSGVAYIEAQKNFYLIVSVFGQAMVLHIATIGIFVIISIFDFVANLR